MDRIQLYIFSSVFLILGIVIFAFNKGAVNFLIGIDMFMSKMVPFSMTYFYIKKYGAEKTKKMMLEGKIYGNMFIWGYFLGIVFLFIGGFSLFMYIKHKGF
jgi:hypothetical protein